MNNETNRILNDDPICSHEFRIGNIISSPPDGIGIINAISQKVIEVQSLFENDVELHLVEMKNISGFALISGYNEAISEMIFKENGFIKSSIIHAEKVFVDGSIMKIDIGFNKNGWDVSYKGIPNYINYVHEFQNLYFALTKEELKIKQFKRVLS